MRLSRNLLAGVTNSIWAALIGLAVVPFYLKYLGVEAYGLIGFFVTTQAVLSLLDMGMAPTINREVARCSALGNLTEAGKLLHTLAVVYWGMAALIAVLIISLAPLIADYWLQSKQLSSQAISRAVILMGFVVACRWPIGLYQGALIGAQRLALSSAVNLVMATIGSLGAVAVLVFVSPTIEAFFIWQACTGIVHAIAMRLTAWRIIGKSDQIKFDFVKFKSVWRFTAGMSGISLTSLLFTQLDKLMLSKMLSLEEFGYYMLATVVVSGLHVMISPVFNVIYPRMTALVATGDTVGLTDFYRVGTRLLLAVLFPAAMVLAIFSEDLVRVWTGNLGIAISVAPVMALLAVGSALNGVMHFPYALQLAYGMTWIPLLINIVLMCFIAPLIIFLTQTYGALGGAMAWVTTAVAYLFLGPWLTHRFMLKNVGSKWLFQDVGIPLLISVLIGIISYHIVHSTEYSTLLKFMWGGGLVLSAFGLIFLISIRLNSAAWSFVRLAVLNPMKK